MKVTEIETYRSSYDIRFSGTLRNQFNFKLGEMVFIRVGNQMLECEIIGKERLLTRRIRTTWRTIN